MPMFRQGPGVHYFGENDQGDRQMRLQLQTHAGRAEGAMRVPEAEDTAQAEPLKAAWAEVQRCASDTGTEALQQSSQSPCSQTACWSARGQGTRPLHRLFSCPKRVYEEGLRTMWESLTIFFFFWFV